MKRPWITPEDVRKYTDHADVAERSDEKLKVDIARAEGKVISITHNDFSDEEKYPEIPEPVKIATLLLAEAYAKNAIEAAKTRFKSETFDDYSYSLESGMIDIDGLDLGYLLDDYVLDAKRGSFIFRMTAI